MMKTLSEIIHLSAQYLKSHSIENSKREAEDLIAYVLKKKRIDLYLDFSMPLTENELVEIRKVIKERSLGVPFAYIVKQVAFCGALFEITSAVLVPRPETELLVELASEKLKKISLENKVLWDICTGSGCIGISLKKRFPELTVILSDLSPDAVTCAKKNCLLNRVEVDVRQGDLFTPFIGQTCDFLLCNPPYLTESEYEKSSLEIKKEPKIAFIGGKDGYDFYSRIAEQLSLYLAQDGKAFFELGTGQGEGVKRIFEERGYSDGTIQNDYAGHTRFFFLE